MIYITQKNYHFLFIFLILLTLSLFFPLPEISWGAIDVGGGGGGGGECCIDGPVYCVGEPPNEWCETSKICGLKYCDDDDDDDDDDDEPVYGWKCDFPPYGACLTGTCNASCSYQLNGTYSTEAACNSNCNSRCACSFFKKCRCVKGSGDQCSSNSDCQNGGTDPTPVRYECKTSNWTCEENTSGYDTLNACEDACTQPGTTPTPKCSVKATANPNPIPEGQNQVTISATNFNHTSNNKCKVSGYSLSHTFTQTSSSHLYTVRCTGNTGYDDCSSSVRVRTEGTTPDPTTPPTTTIPCTINIFELPKRAWVDIETTAHWSTNDVCTHAEIKCISDNCIEAEEEIENLSGEVIADFNQYKNFTIYAPGTYRYELVACIGPIPANPGNDDNCDIYEDVTGTGEEYIEVEALYLPWWQEIIPVLPDNLQGFLKGLFEFN